MKIGVITLHGVRNYGSVLQAYATEKLLKKAGGEPFFIDYRRHCDLYPVESWLSHSTSWNKSLLTSCLFRVLKTPSAAMQNRIFGAFLEELPLTRQYHSLEELISDPPLAPIYCTGSDQVFNSHWNGGVDLAYFQTWTPDAYLFSFSSSFGRDSLELWEQQEAAALLKRFHRLSFREPPPLSQVPQFDMPQALCFPDPVLLLQPESWVQFAQAVTVAEKFILIYQLTHSEELDLAAQNLSNETGFPLIRISTFYDHLRYPGRLIFCPTPQQFLYLFSKASCVFTDSFHGTAFSIIFRRSFRVFLPSRFSYRIENLLDMTGLSHFSSCKDIFLQEVNWDEIHHALQEKRDEAQAYLRQVLYEAQEQFYTKHRL